MTQQKVKPKPHHNEKKTQESTICPRHTKNPLKSNQLTGSGFDDYKFKPGDNMAEAETVKAEHNLNPKHNLKKT